MALQVLPKCSVHLKDATIGKCGWQLVGKACARRPLESLLANPSKDLNPTLCDQQLKVCVFSIWKGAPCRWPWPRTGEGMLLRWFEEILSPQHRCIPARLFLSPPVVVQAQFSASVCLGELRILVITD